MQASNSQVTFETNVGTFTVELYADKAPITVANFLQYAKDGFYEGTVFHRVIKGFMNQGGGFDENMAQKPVRAPIKNEAKNGLKNDKYTLAMARTSVVDSATAQFFVNAVNNDFLNYSNDANYGYAVFGKVVAGTEVIDEINKVRTITKKGYQDVPQEAVVVTKVTVQEACGSCQ